MHALHTFVMQQHGMALRGIASLASHLAAGSASRLPWIFGAALAAALAAGAALFLDLLVRELNLPLLGHLGPRDAVQPDADALGPRKAHGVVMLVMIALNIALVWVLACRLTDRQRQQDSRELLGLRDLASLSSEGLLLCEDETIVGSNDSFERTMSCKGEDLLGRRLGDILPGLTAGTIPTLNEVSAHLACGESGSIPVRIVGRPIVVGQKRLLAVAVRDQRETLRTEARMARLAHQDPLTGLANRLSFSETLAGRFLLPMPGEDGFALLMLDLDRFKTVNDTLGHGIGDELLRRVAVRLRQAVREDDLVARLGGDEFAILAVGSENLTAIHAIAEDVIELIGRPFLIDGHVIEVAVSIGIALAPADGDEPGGLSRSADLALYRAKQEGGGTCRLFEAEMNAAMQARRALELDLRRAVARREFEVFYQPQVDPVSGAFEGAEALVRWNHPERGIVSPADFIPLAEEIGLIGSIGDHVLRTACAEAARWPEHLSVAVNLSPVQLRDARLAAQIAAILKETGLAGSRLELELTESALLQDEGHTLATLEALRRQGVRVALDDFGTGYSSLSYLRHFPFDKIKIDRSFIRQIPGDPDSVAIVQAIASLGTKLRMTVTVEGVETQEQRAFAVAEGCDQIQGFLISRPVPAAQVTELFGARSTTQAVA